MSSRGEDAERLKQLVAARDSRDVVYLLESLKRDPENATLPAKWLSEWGEARATPILVRLLNSQNDSTRMAALRGLIRLGPPPEAKERLIEMAIDDRNAAGRSWACVGLGKYRDPEIVEFLLSLLGHDDHNVRAGAASGLGEAGDPQALEPIRVALRRLRRHPIQWYLSRLAYKRAIEQLHTGALTAR